MTLPILRSVREFFDGIRVVSVLIDDVRALIHFSAMQKEFERTISELEAEHAAHADTRRDRNAARDNATRTEQQLASETAARKEAERKLAIAWQQGWNNCCDYHMAKIQNPGMFTEPSNPYAVGTPESLDAMEKAGSDV